MIYLKLFIAFFKIGLFTFGGGYAMLPLIEESVVSHGWLDSSDLVNFIAVSESTPGPFAINISTYVGSEVGGFLGAFFSTLGVVTPSFFIILLVAKFYEKFKKSLAVKGCMNGLKPAVIGLIGAAVISIGHTVFFPTHIGLEALCSPSFLISLGILSLMTFISFKNAHPILIVALSAALGIMFGYILDL